MTGGPSEQRPAWLADFDVPDAPTGAVIALDFSGDGLWAARIENDAVVESVTESRIHPDVLDARIAAFLRDTEKVAAPTPEVFGELVAVVNRGRSSLIGRDSSLTMGFENLRLVRLTLDDVIEATVPEVNRAHGMIVELARRDPVDAVLLGPGHDAWPGLWEALTERGFSVLLPGDEFPVTFGGDDEETRAFAAVPEPTPVRAWEDTAADPSWVNPADYGLDRFGNAPVEAASGDEPTPEAATLMSSGLDEQVGDEQAGDGPPAEPAMRGRLVLLGSIVVIAVAVAAVALAMNAHETSGPDRTLAQTATTAATSPPTTEFERVNAVVDPADLAAARAPIARYTTPRPTPTTTRPRSTQARPGVNPPEPHRPKRRVIPNPIPGLPPIVIG